MEDYKVDLNHVVTLELKKYNIAVIAGDGIGKEVIAGRHLSVRCGCVVVCHALRATINRGGGFGRGIPDSGAIISVLRSRDGVLLSLLSRLCDLLLQKLWSIVKVRRFFERWPRFRIVTGDHLSARLPDYLVQLLNGAHRVNGRG